MDIVCNLDLNKYPFDYQYCEFKILLEEVNIEFAVISPLEVEFSGNKILSEYEVLDFFNKTVNWDGHHGQEIILVMRNMYTYYLTSTYIPTLLLVLISYLTFWFEVKDFSNRIMVALTSLLVLACLFSQISSDLPHTAYLKMIDIWFMSCIIIDFIMISFLVIINRLHVINSTICNKCAQSCCLRCSKAVNTSAKVLMLLMIIFFVFAYCIYIGLSDKDPMGLYNGNIPKEFNQIPGLDKVIN